MAIFTVLNRDADCTTPTNLKANNVTGTSLVLTWDHFTNNAVSYQVEITANQLVNLTVDNALIFVDTNEITIDATLIDDAFYRSII